jgi:hypothetical protein
VYERYAVPGLDHILFQAGLANFNPHAATWPMPIRGLPRRMTAP